MNDIKAGGLTQLTFEGPVVLATTRCCTYVESYKGYNTTNLKSTEVI